MCSTITSTPIILEILSWGRNSAIILEIGNITWSVSRMGPQCISGTASTQMAKLLLIGPLRRRGFDLSLILRGAAMPTTPSQELMTTPSRISIYQRASSKTILRRANFGIRPSAPILTTSLPTQNPSHRQMAPAPLDT